MPKPKVLSGKEVVDILRDFGFRLFSQKGSHMKLVRELSGTRQVLTVPNHKELDRGTMVSIIRQAARFIEEQELKKHFYTN